MKTTKSTKNPKTRREREVWEACDELWEELCKEGLPVSKLIGEKIKTRLVDLGYNRGNQGQIYQYRNSWQLSRGIEEDDDLVQEERKFGLSEKVQKAVELLFKEVQIEAEEKISKSKSDSDNKVAEISKKNETINRENEFLRDKLDTISQELHTTKQANSKISSELTKEKHEHAISREKLSGAEARVIQLSTESEKREKLLNERNEKDKKEAQGKINDLISAHKKDLSALKEYSENQRHQYIVEIDNLKSTNSKLDKQLDKVTLLEQKANNSNVELKQRIKTIKGELTHSNSANKELVQKAHNAEKELAETKGELKQLQILLNHQKEDYQEANKQLLDYKERVGRLEEQLQQAKQVQEVEKMKETKEAKPKFGKKKAGK